MSRQSSRKTSNVGAALLGALLVLGVWLIFQGGRQPTTPGRTTIAGQGQAERMGHEKRREFNDQQAILLHRRWERASQEARRKALRKERGSARHARPKPTPP